MKKLALVVFAATVIAAPAFAQNPRQIASVRAGHNCPGCNLFQADLSNSELQHKNYAGARLRQANLSVTEMNGTNLSRTDLRDVNAYAGRFTSASFAGANLTNATFVGTFLGGANFKGATLEGANFGGAEMGSARGLSQAQLNKACGDGSTIVPKGLHIPSCK
jgi:uncharacterized protein YjbI with pentapeptide repeats